MRWIPRTSPLPSTPLAVLMGLALVGPACKDGGDGRDDSDDTGGGTDTEADDDDDDDDTADTTDSDTDTDGDTSGIDIEPVPGGIRKLISREYIGSVTLLLGPEAAAAADPPVDTPQEGFDAVGATLLSLDGVQVEQYELSARAVADAAVANKATLGEHVPCVLGTGDASCYEQVARDFGRLAYRRPLEQVEIDTLVDVALDGQAWGDGEFDSGIKYLLTVILQSPSFLYVVEVGEPDEASGFRKLSPSEIATRMSFFLLGRTPDDSLLDKAESGELGTNSDIRTEAEAMIESSFARQALAGFFDEYLRLRNLPTTAKNPEIFPLFNEELAAAMRQETLLLVHNVIWEENLPYQELFTADYTFVNDQLADLYDMNGPGSDEHVQVQWPAGQDRAGYLSQASFLTHQSNSLRNSPTKRGRFVQQSVLCNEIPPPPPDVDPTLPPIPDDATLREILDMHKEQEGCTCHQSTDPIGFAFEYYDAIGAYRTTENGQPIDASGSVEGLGEWNNAAEFAALLAEDPRVSTCLIQNLIRGQIGHKETPGETEAIFALDEEFAADAFSVRELLADFPLSPLFQYVDEPR
jgi:hypothetical protein